VFGWGRGQNLEQAEMICYIPKLINNLETHNFFLMKDKILDPILSVSNENDFDNSSGGK